MSEEKNIFYAQQDELMENAYQQAQKNFKYFWRELYWEYKRIVPALDLAIVKIPFGQVFEGKTEPVIEHMWISQIDFDGENIRGILINRPNELTNIAEGDEIEIELNEISDWMFACQGKTYGGYTIQLLRSEMSESERKQHDEAWGLDFGDHNNVLVAYEQEEYPENLIEHPMSKNMEETIHNYFKENPVAAQEIEANGLTILQNETVAGNKTVVDILLKFNANKNMKSKSGKTALDYAQALNWEHLIPVLQ